jgi:hypothetical protein
MILTMPMLGVLALLPLASAGPQETRDTTRICLAHAKVEANTGSATTIADAVREAFTTLLAGPSLKVAPLSARLESQARQEAKEAACPYLLVNTVKHVRKTGGGGLLGRMAGGAVQQGAWSAGATAGSTLGGIAAGAAANAAGAAVNDYAIAVRTKDELTLTYRLESAAGAVIIEKVEKRKAESDGEDLLTPVVEHAAEAIAAAVTTRPQ